MSVDEPEFPEMSGPILLQPEGTLIISAVETKVGKINYLLPGDAVLDARERQVMVADFFGHELASGEAGHVTIVFEMPGVANWCMRVLSMLAKMGWWKP